MRAPWIKDRQSVRNEPRGGRAERAEIAWRDPNWKKKQVQVTPLQHWFLDFAHQRNELLLQGNLQKLEYKRRKRYRGPHFFTASRVLLEAMRTKVGVHVGKRLALRPWDRSKKERYAELADLLKRAIAEGTL